MFINIFFHFVSMNINFCNHLFMEQFNFSWTTGYTALVGLYYNRCIGISINEFHRAQSLNPLSAAHIKHFIRSCSFMHEENISRENLYITSKMPHICSYMIYIWSISCIDYLYLYMVQVLFFYVYIQSSYDRNVEA